MTGRRRSGWWPILAAFTIWLAHFLACWAASEVWPHRWPANAAAWGATAAALLALALHFARVRAQRGAGEVSGWHHRFARGAIAVATAAVLFGALPSVVFLP